MDRAMSFTKTNYSKHLVLLVPVVGLSCGGEAMNDSDENILIVPGPIFPRGGPSGILACCRWDNRFWNRSRKTTFRNFVAAGFLLKRDFNS